MLGSTSSSAVGRGPGTGSGATSFEREVQRHVIVRHNSAKYPATATTPAYSHDDLMVIYFDGASIRADYYDSEGHIARYAVRTPAAGTAVFVSDVVSGAPRYRLTYKLAVDGTVAGAFEIAPAGKPEAFAPYLAWTARKK